MLNRVIAVRLWCLSWETCHACHLPMQHLPLFSSAIVSNVSFSCTMSRELSVHLWGYLQINEDAGSIKSKTSQLPVGNNMTENQNVLLSIWDNYSSEELCSTGCKRDLRYNYTNKGQPSTLSRTHTQFQKVPSWKKEKRNLSRVSMVTEQSRLTYSLSLVYQDYFFTKLSWFILCLIFVTNIDWI